MPPPELLQPVSDPYPAHPGLDGVMPPLHAGVVPPTPMTCGEFAGWSTLTVIWQSRLPLSREAANHDWPAAFAFVKMLSSVRWTDVDRPASQSHQLVVTTCPGLSVTMRLYMGMKALKEVDAA